ncbi:MAG TPA: GNAT family N-acetyltransferase [Pirellulales bacterium]|jgi:CelD/BcsL family acetyltransferase involved in cellulose biosynthesis|nr:GNAT family N-acetyltransferase [Pirellulales bacterium]
MQVARIYDVDELARLSTTWNRLAGDVPFRRCEWLIPWWRHYGPAISSVQRQVELFTIGIYDSDQLVGLAPWFIDRSPTRGRVVRFLGSGEVCSDYLTVLAAPGQEEDVADALADWLSRAAQTDGADRWDVLALAGVEKNDPTLNRLVAQLYEDRASVYRQPAASTWRIDLPATWPEYLVRLSKSHRKQIRRLERRVLDTGDVTLHTATNVAEMREAWRHLTNLHQRRMQSVGQCGCFQSATFSAFHRDATSALFHAGLLRIHWLERAGQAIAAEYHLIGGRTLYVYQGGIDPDLLREEPGRLATIATLRQALAEDFHGFDFCRGDEGYKAHWRATAQDMVDWRIAANRSGARLRQGVWAVRRNALGWVRRRLDVSRSDD